ncbi:hypothetical protein [Jeongeupia naejangsanensis]|uniref:Uncharacterized protein n=1 Tax=Jeongeupia naejangsanensis TaxID=613195 RepID=A0ABS2BMS8_9NEIS|nr:hypothetical protein [Jeongeupia naejangsanensis]MBM3116942.1 hypothetical protein [Jeongeupia naejangsanensis]
MLEIDCPCHGGSQIISSVCGHLVQNPGIALGFIENSDDPENKQGWCYACELVYLQEEDKTERFRSFTHHAVVCSHCYDEIKLRHDFDSSFFQPSGANDDA